MPGKVSPSPANWPKTKRTSRSQDDLAWSLDELGDVKLQAGDSGGATAAYQEGLHHPPRAGHGQGHPPPAPTRTLSAISRGPSTGSGYAKLQAGDTEGALAADEESLVIARELVRDKGNADAQRDLSVPTLDRLGDLKLKTGDIAGTLAAYQESLAIGRELAKDKGNEDAQRDLATSLGKMREAEMASGRPRRRARRRRGARRH